MLNIYSVNSQTFDIINPPNSQLALPSGVTALNSKFIATDIQGRSLVLGEPTKVTISATKPDIIVGMPPMHIDYITPVGGNKPEVLNISFIPDGFNSSFSLTQDSQTGSTTTGKLSWSAGVDVSVTGHYQIGDPDGATGFRAKVGADVASNFTGSSGNSNVTYTGSSYKIGATAKTGDQVYFDSSRQNIWVYPAIGQKGCPSTTPNCTADQQVPMTFQFSGPDQIETGQTSTEDFGSFWYQPAWEFANVLSYPANLAQLTLLYPQVASDPTKTILSSQTSFKPTYNNTQIQATWSSGQTQGSTSSFSNLTSFSISASYTDNYGVGPIAQGGFDTSLKLSGSVGFDHLQENTAQIDASNGIGITSNAHFLDTGNYGYWVTPYILGNPPSVAVADSKAPPQADIQTIGPLTTVFTADPTNTTEGGAWWSQSYAYGSLPDVALNHPARWTPSNPGLGGTLPSNCGNYGTGASDLDCFDIAPLYDDNGQPLDPWLSNFLSMRGFFISRVDDPSTGPQLGFAIAGDQLDLAVRVYNYSLAAMPDDTTVHVRFYAMPVDGNGNSLGDSTLIGESVADPIPPFCGDGSLNCNSSDVNWRVMHAPAPFDTTPYAGKFFAFWVVVWMQDANGVLVKEIQGHGLTSVPGTLTKPSDVPLETATATDGKTQVSYSNNVGFYHYAFPVLPKPNGLGAPPPANPEDITLKAVTAAKGRVQIGELDVITAVLRAGSEGAKKLKVYFYDGDPEAGGNLINTQIAWFEPRTVTKVRIPYHPPQNGVYNIWAVINKGQPYQTVRHTAAILVGNAVADRNNLDGDPPTNDSKSMLRSPIDQTGQKLNLK